MSDKRSAKFANDPVANIGVRSDGSSDLISLVDAAVIALSIWIFTKLKLREYAAWMLGVLVGHTLWMSVGYGTLFLMGKPNPEFTTVFIDLAAPDDLGNQNAVGCIEHLCLDLSNNRFRYECGSL